MERRNLLLSLRVLPTRALLAACLLFANSFASLATAAVFPSPSIGQNNDTGSNRYYGVKRNVYMVVHSASSPISSTAWTTRVNSIRNKEIGTRQFFAENSGGKLDLYYDPIIVDAGIVLNPDGTRPSDWVTQANNIATSAPYNLNLNNYYMYAYDVDDTQPDPGQGWGGLSTGDRIYLQSTGQTLINHEIGHRISLPHAEAIIPRNDSAYKTYVWNDNTNSYQSYTPGSLPYNATPYGSSRHEYGDSFDTMGNGDGHFSVSKKNELGWLTNSQVPTLNINTLNTPTTYRIYAHDELQATTINAPGTYGGVETVYGVVEGYNPSIDYGLKFERTGKYLNTNNGSFIDDDQRIFIEYRSGMNGVLFYMNSERIAGDNGNSFSNDRYAALLDMDRNGTSSSGNQTRLLNIGSSVEDIDFGMSNFFQSSGSIGGSNPTNTFLDYGPVSPPDPTSTRPSWFHFRPLSTGSDSIGSYIDILVSKVTSLNDIAGDLNQSGQVTQADMDLFISGWLMNTEELSSTEKYMKGDMNFDGITDLKDAWLFREAWLGAGNSSFDFNGLGLNVPEPSSIAIALILAAIGTLKWRALRRAE